MTCTQASGSMALSTWYVSNVLIFKALGPETCLSGNSLSSLGQVLNEMGSRHLYPKKQQAQGKPTMPFCQILTSPGCPLPAWL